MPVQLQQTQVVRLEDVDRGVKRWFERVVDAHVQTPQGDRRAVPVLFAAGERWVAASDRRGIRDRDGRLILPVIQVHRTGFDAVKHGTALGTDVPTITFAQPVSDKTTAYASLDALRPISERRLRGSAVYDILTVPFPRQGGMVFKVTVQAQYQTQLNEIIEKIISRLNFVSVPSFVISLVDDVRPQGARDGQGSTELVNPLEAPFEERAGLRSPYVVGYVDGSVNDDGNLDEFTDQERILQLQFTFRVPTTLLLDPEGTAPAVQRTRTAYTVELGDEQTHFVDRIEDLDLIFGREK